MGPLEELTVAARRPDALADLTLTPPPGAWAAAAACVTLGDVDAFTPPTKPNPDELVVAAGVCRHSSVRAECADYAARWAVYGVWTGR